MIITRETDYAIRLLRALADGSLRSMQPLCSAEDIPLKFAYKILRKLKDAGIVKSISGKNGGYQLTKDLNSFTLLELIQAVEGTPYFNSCMKPGYECGWCKKKGEDCNINQNMRKLQQELEDVLSGFTMERLIFE